MEMRDGVVSPPGRTPESLAKQAAHSLATQLINTSLPAITLYWKENLTKRTERPPITPTRKKNPSKRSLIKHLQNIKEWYHGGKSLSYHGSYIKELVSEACGEALTSYLGKEDCELLYLFTLQLMFCREAGFFSQRRKFYDNRTSRSYGEFLRFFVPFEVESLYTTCINFQHHTPILVLLRHSPNLKHVRLFHNLSDGVLAHLRKHCRRLETITLSGHGLVSEQCLFRMFFTNMTKSEVVGGGGGKICLSFPHLRTFNMLMDLNCDEIMFFIQYHYRGVRTKWTKCVAENWLSPLLLSSLIGPPFLLKDKGKFHMDNLELRLNVNTLDKWTLEDSVSNFPVVRHVSIFYHFRWGEVQDLGVKIKDIIKRLNCTSFSHSSPPVENLDALTVCVPTLETFGAPFSEMHLSTFEVVDAKILFQCLNLCPNLRVFSVSASRIVMNSDCPRNALSPMINLNTLRVCVKASEGCDVSCLRCLVNSAPSLTTLEMMGGSLHDFVREFAISGALSRISVISLHRSLIWFSETDLDYCITLGKHMSSLSVMMLNPVSECFLNLIKRYFANTKLKVIQCNKMLR